MVPLDIAVIMLLCRNLTINEKVGQPFYKSALGHSIQQLDCERKFSTSE